MSLAYCWYSTASLPWVQPHTTVPWHHSVWFRSSAFLLNSSIPQTLHSAPLAGQGGLICSHRKCLMSEPGVVYLKTHSFSRRLAFPRQRKQIKGCSSEFLICTDSIALCRVISVLSFDIHCCCLAGGQGWSPSGAGHVQDWMGQGMGHPSSTGQNTVITLIVLIQCWYSALRVASGIVSVASITIRCWGGMKLLCLRVSITFISTNFPASYHSRSITGCLFLYCFRFSQTCQFYCYCFSLYSLQTALLYLCFASII